MKKIYINLFLVFVLMFSFIGTAYAVPASLDITASVDVSTSCSVTDTDGVAHDYPKGDSYLAICALEAALSNGVISSADLSNQYPSMGLFITAINSVAADPSSQYWALYQNGSYAALGLSSLPVSAGDAIVLQLHDFSDNNLGDQLTLNINSLVNDPSPGIGGGSVGGWTDWENLTIQAPKPVFDLEKAFGFLISQQKENGSFEEDIYTDWATIALASSSNYADKKTKLVKYFSENKLAGTVLTDYERRTMALISLGLNPYNANSENYVEKITDSFDGRQFGDPSQDNDDIFALIVLQNAGFAPDEKIIADTVSFMLAEQKTNGSWDESVDLTGAAMEALSAFKEQESVRIALEKAKNFLKQNQNENGGWANVSSTAWAMQGILALGEKPEDWVKNQNTPLDYLAVNQDTDGGIKNDHIKNKIWETAYAVSALSDKTWNQTMQKFEKPPAPVLVEIPEETAKKQEVQTIETNNIKVSTPKNTEQKTKKLEKLASQNTATALMAVPNAPAKENITEPPKKPSWLRRFFNKILEIF